MVEISELYYEGLFKIRRLTDPEFSTVSRPLSSETVTYISKDIAKDVASEKISRLESFFEKSSQSDRMLTKKYRHWIFAYTTQIISHVTTVDAEKILTTDVFQEFLKNLRKLEKCKTDKSWATELIKSGVTVDYSLPIPTNYETFEIIFKIWRNNLNFWPDKSWTTNHVISHLLKSEAARSSALEIKRYSIFSYVKDPSTLKKQAAENLSQLEILFKNSSEQKQLTLRHYRCLLFSFTEKIITVLEIYLKHQSNR